MKSFKTYGKKKCVRDIKTDEWDKIQKEESLQSSRKFLKSENATNATEVEHLLGKLTINQHSTPIITPVTTTLVKDKSLILESTPVKERNYSFKCSRSICVIFNNSLSLRKRNSGLLSTSIADDKNSLLTSCTINGSSLKEILTPSLCIENTEKKLLDLCKQDLVLDINELIENCTCVKKIGEGSYGEVFLMNYPNLVTIKIVPVGGEGILVNGYDQMTLEEIIPEMVISRKLSVLSSNENLENYRTDGFIHLNKLIFCKGKYPQTLITLWENWKKDNDSENDHPGIFDVDQQYILFEADYGGRDLEKTNIKTLKEALSILKQLVASLACAESLFQFEHRDLHHGNILVKQTDRKMIATLIDGKSYEIETQGLLVHIIDFTMARLITDDCVVFTDLENETVLFEGEGDIQFEVYRNMKKHNNNEWESYNPYTNVLWMYYVVEKLIIRINATAKLKKLLSRLLSYKSCLDILENDPLLKT